VIYRLAEAHDWEAARTSGSFASTDLTAEGFIHCCTAAQIAAVANRYYQGYAMLVLLEIDEHRLSAPLRWEDLRQAGEAYPHVYGRIPYAAIRRRLLLRPGPDGRFTAPQRVPQTDPSGQYPTIQAT